MIQKTDARKNADFGRSKFGKSVAESRDETLGIAITASSAIDLIDETRTELVAMISALRDEMATRFNTLADEVDKIGADAVAEKKDGATSAESVVLSPEDWGLVIALLYTYNKPDSHRAEYLRNRVRLHDEICDQIRSQRARR